MASICYFFLIKPKELIKKMNIKYFFNFWFYPDFKLQEIPKSGFLKIGPDLKSLLVTCISSLFGLDVPPALSILHTNNAPVFSVLFYSQLCYLFVQLNFVNFSYGNSFKMFSLPFCNIPWASNISLVFYSMMFALFKRLQKHIKIFLSVQ